MTDLTGSDNHKYNISDSQTSVLEGYFTPTATLQQTLTRTGTVQMIGSFSLHDCLPSIVPIIIYSLYYKNILSITLSFLTEFVVVLVIVVW